VTRPIAHLTAAAAGLAALALVAIAASPRPAWSQSTVAAATAAAPTTQPQPSNDRDGRPLRGGPAGDRSFDGRNDGGARQRLEWRRGSDFRPENFSEPTPDEWKEIEAFMKSNSPERFKRLDDIGDDQRQQGVRNMFAARYRMLQDLKERDPEIYQIRLARMPIEDKVFELGWKLSRRQGEKPDDIKKELRQQFRVLLKSQFDERALHLRRMEKRLASDQQRIEEMVDANLNDLAEERMPRNLRPQAPLRRERPREEDTPNTTNATPTVDQ
jgi:hypothetical protein